MNTFQYIFKTCLAVVLFLFIHPLIAFSSIDVSAIQAGVFPVNRTASAGDTVSYAINVNNNQSVTGIQFNIAYDPAVLKVDSVSGGSATAQWNVLSNTNAAGLIKAGMYFYNPLASGNSLEIAVVRFTVLQPGTQLSGSSITLSAVEFDETPLLTGNVTSGSFVLTAAAVNQAPVLNAIGNKQITAGASLTFNISATDADNDPLTFSTSTLPSGATFTASTFDWKPTSAQVGTTNITFTVSDGKTTVSESIVITVAAQTHSITATAGSGGTIAPNGVNTVNDGSTTTFTVTPASGYSIEKVLVDGAVATLINSKYVFSNVTADHTISVAFSTTKTPITGALVVDASAAKVGDVKSVNVTFGNAVANTYYAADVWLEYDPAVLQLTQSDIVQGNVSSMTFSANIPQAGLAKVALYGTTPMSGTSGTLVSFNFKVLSVPTAGTTNLHLSKIVFYADTSSDAAVAADQTIAIVHGIAASAGAGGSISPSGIVNVNNGASQKFTVTPATGYDLAGVFVDGSTTAATLAADNSYTFSDVTASHTINATFMLRTNTITPSAGTGGSISPATAVSVPYGTDQKFTVTPTTGYKAVGAFIDGSTTSVPLAADNTYTFTNVTAAHTISVSFTLQTNAITPSAGTGGSISPATTVSVPYGTSQKFTVTPLAGYNITGVFIDGSTTAVTLAADKSYTFSSVTAPHTISATFTLQTNTITPTAGTGGSISPAAAVSVPYGSSQKFTVTPTTGYNISGVFVDGGTTAVTLAADNSYTFSNVTGAHTINATFTLQTNTITPTAGTGGSISPAAAVSVPYGSSQKFTVTPATGYNLTAVFVDGGTTAVTLAADNSYTFSNVTGPHTINATFTLKTNTITPSVGTGGTISPAAAVSVPYGSSQKFTVTALPGYGVYQAFVDGSTTPVVLAADNSYIFSNVLTTHTISATCVMYGDLNNNSGIDAGDASVAARIAVGSYTPTAEQLKKAGVDLNAGVSAMDASWIARKAVNAGLKFPIEL